MFCKVRLAGCDDETVVSLEVTEEQLAALRDLEYLSGQESTYGCMPVLVVEEP